MQKLFLALAIAASQGAFASELECLASTIYTEARGEPLVGKIGVGYTALNRKKHTGLDLCTITRLWYNRRHIPKKDRGEYLKLARQVMSGVLKNPIGKREFFDSLKRLRTDAIHVLRIANHRFYNVREKR